MRKLILSVIIITVATAIASSFITIKPGKTIPSPPSVNYHLSSDTILYPDEKHFKNVQQLTFGGDNAEAYWSYDGRYIVFQRTILKKGCYATRYLLERFLKNPVKNLNTK